MMGATVFANGSPHAATRPHEITLPRIIKRGSVDLKEINSIKEQHKREMIEQTIFNTYNQSPVNNGAAEKQLVSTHSQRNIREQLT